MFDFKKFIEESNAEFTAASKKEQRIIIAKDVLLRIKHEQLHMSPGSLITGEDFRYHRNNNPDFSFQEYHCFRVKGSSAFTP